MLFVHAFEMHECYIAHTNISFICCFFCCAGLSKAETQALTNYGSGEDENEEEEVDEFEAGPVDVQTSLQASTDGHVEQEARATVSYRVFPQPAIDYLCLDSCSHLYLSKTNSVYENTVHYTVII